MNAPRFPEVSVGRLFDLAETVALIHAGNALVIAADQGALMKLPRGKWIAGTIPYFMGQDGGEASRDKYFVSPVPSFATSVRLMHYDTHTIKDICHDAPANGYSLIIIPAFSALHSQYAREAPGYDEMYMKPIAGWIAGIHLDDLGKNKPGVMLGADLKFDSERAVVMHVELPPDRWAHIDIQNPFSQGDGDVLRFPDTGFSTGMVMVNGQPQDFAEYIKAKAIDTRLPLVADYCGAMVNVSIQAVNPGKVDFYAPVFNDMDYRFAAPVEDFGGVFQTAGCEAPAAFCCNCILNYLYCNLEGHSTGGLLGPMTFGEVAYQLLNQTMVYLTIEG